MAKSSGPAYRFVKRFDYREFFVIVAVNDKGSYRAIARNEKKAEVCSCDGDSQDDVEATIKARLAELSNEFVGMNSAINLFLKAFPDGFETPLYLDWERTYKQTASDKVRAELSASVFDEAIAADDLEDLCQQIRSGIQATNLVSPFEKARISDALKQPRFQKRYVPALGDLLHGDHDAAFQAHVSVLKEGDALTWPIATYFPFLHDPERNMFMKPEVMQTCALRLGYDLHYETPPVFASYKSLLELTEFVREGISALNPQDNIDIHSFLYAVGAPGYMEEVAAYKEMHDAGGTEN